jgi:hypothetical protein
VPFKWVNLHRYGVVGCPGMTKAKLEAEFPGCQVPDELADGWWTEQQGCETVPQVRDADTTRREYGGRLWGCFLVHSFGGVRGLRTTHTHAREQRSE